RPAWRNRMYLEIAPYPSGKTRLHGGNHVRRDIVLPKHWAHGGSLVELEMGARVHGVHVPSAPPVGGKVYVEVGVSQQDVRGQDDFGMWLTARHGEHVQRWDIAPGYGWIGASEWRQDEIFHGKYSLDVPKTLPPGGYALTLTIVGAEGEVRHVEATGEPEVAVGTLTLLSEADALAAAERDRESALASAEALRCADAEQDWFLARKHQVADPDWRKKHHDTTKRALAECWATKAADVDRDTKVDHLVRAREHDHWAPTYRAAARALAQELYDEGLVAREKEDWERAYRRFSDAVAVDRSWSWARRYAEEARAERLGLGPREEKTANR
ncbi:MAG: hypothetical protein AAF602_31875, partial [Myxococcota bacterium]